MEAVRQGVQQKAPDKLVRRQGYGSSRAPRSQGKTITIFQQPLCDKAMLSA